MSGTKYVKYNINIEWKKLKIFLHSEIFSNDKSAGNLKL